MGRQDVMESTITENREALLKSADAEVVELDRYVELLTSRATLTRDDDATASMCGLRDHKSGNRYLVGAERLINM